MSPNFPQAAEAIANADALVFAAGAGMGVDSGLPDFRGTEGFWKAYPPFAQRGLTFENVANPQWFHSEPEMAWGFYGHRMNLYRATRPHAGFQLLRKWADAKPYFIFTSNVDGHFQKAGFDPEKIVEYHGSIAHLQCSIPCCEEIWAANDLEIIVDEETFLAEQPLPACPHCGQIARPNILMFHDNRWLWNRTKEQQRRCQAWQSSLENKELVVIECGAGRAVPTVRDWSENLQSYGATLVRINPREAQGPSGTISLGCGALEALAGIEQFLARN